MTLFFLHIPKTAGSTLRQILVAEYGSGFLSLGNMFKGAGGVDEEALWQLGATDIPPTVKLLTGHLPFEATELLPVETRNFTILRDPVERTISHYFFLANGSEKAKETGPLRRKDFEAVLKSGSLFPDNIQTRMLANQPAVGEPCTESMLKQAKRNLTSRFEVVGLVERFSESLVLFAQAFGWRSPLYRGRARTTSDRPAAGDLSRSEQRAVKRTTGYDQELYEYAKKLFERQIAAQDERFQFELSALRAAQDMVEHGDGTATGRPRHDDAVECRTHQLCAEFEVLEQRERVRSLRRGERDLRRELGASKAKVERLTKLNAELRMELARLEGLLAAVPPEAPVVGEPGTARV